MSSKHNGNAGVIDWRIVRAGREKYQAYLASREWGLLREAVKERSGGICERCNKNGGTAVHHVTYARLYCERLEDLIHLCDECHDFLHGRSDFDPAAPNGREFVTVYYYNTTWRVLLQDKAYLFSLVPYIDGVILNQS